MKRTFVSALTAVAALGAAGCGKAEGRFPFRGVPACASDDAAVTPSLAKPTYAVIKDTVSSGIYRLGDVTERSALRGLADTVTLAVITCEGDLVRGPSAELLADFDSYYIPALCEGQTPLFHAELEASADEISQKMRYPGFFDFPVVSELSCGAGTLVQDDHHTLGQRLDAFYDHVSRFARNHAGRYPNDLAELRAYTGFSDELLDAWKTPLTFISDPPTTAKLVSAGPDKNPGNADDIEVFSLSKYGGLSHIDTYPGTNYAPTGNWAVFLGSR
ncbi:MAG: hypothetical protein AAF928_05530 [Myxococcota bacterium]